MSANWKDIVRNDLKTHKRNKESKDLGVIDPRNAFGLAPVYPPGMLPRLFEDFVTDNVANWGGDPTAYAVGFLAMHCSVLHASVKVQTNPNVDNWRNPNDFALIVGKTGDNKSGLWRDLTKHQKDWQTAMSRAQAQSSRQQPLAFLQNCSVEGMMNQIATNRGERLCVGSEEAMDFYAGAAAHRGDSGAQTMSNTVCTVYDGGIYTKALVKKTITIPEALATLIMTTVDDNITGWKEFQTMIRTGLMARHSIGVINNPQLPNKSKAIPGANDAMGEFMIKLRGLKDMRLRLPRELHERWDGYVARRQIRNRDMAQLKDDSAGVIAYCRKYELRVMSIASIFQLYDFIAGGQLEFTPMEVPATEHDDKMSGGFKIVKMVDISESNLKRAVAFFEKFLIPQQAHFYKVAEGMSEFGMELTNWLAHRVVNDEPDDPHGRELSRNELTYKGPASLRGSPTDERKEKHKRWIRALMDHGFIEPWEHPKQRVTRRFKEDTELPWYKIRPEVFEFFRDEESMEWLREHDRKLKEQLSVFKKAEDGLDI